MSIPLSFSGPHPAKTAKENGFAHFACSRRQLGSRVGVSESNGPATSQNGVAISRMARRQLMERGAASRA